MASATKTDWTAVNLSQYHAGQMCTPWLEERVVRGGDTGTLTLEVRWGWTDATYGRNDPRRNYGEGSCRGRVETCRKAVRAAGIRTDDSRTYM